MRVFGGMDVPKAVEEAGTAEVLQTERMVWNEDDKVMDSEKLKDQDIRVDNVLLCKDGINAVCTYYRLNSIKETYKYRPEYNGVFFHCIDRKSVV